MNRTSCFLGLDQYWSIVWSMHLSKWNRNTIDPHSIFIWSTQINIDSINYDRAKIELWSSAYDRITFNNFSTNFLQCLHSINVVNIDIINIDATLIFDSLISTLINVYSINIFFINIDCVDVFTTCVALAHDQHWSILIVYGIVQFNIVFNKIASRVFMLWNIHCYRIL